MSEKKGFLDKLQGWLMPVGDFLSNEKHFASISAGLMATIGLTLVGAIFQIIASPPVTAQMMAEGGLLPSLFGGWYNFATAYKDILMVPYNMTINLFSVSAAFAIAYQLAKRYEMSAISSGIVSMTIFLMVASPAKVLTLADGSTVTALDTTFLGGTGLFTALLVSLISVEISRMCQKYHIVIKMPDVVPPFLADSFTALIPLLFNIALFYGISVGLAAINPMLSIPTAIMAILSAPLSAINSVPGMLIVVGFATLLWCCGVHGTMIVYPLIMPLMIEAITSNAALVAAGSAPVFSPVMLFGAIAMIGGTGNTLGFVILSMRAKSQQLKAIGKASIIPGLFGINEPVAFGAPIVFNPILMIPYVGGSIILALIMWACYSVGFLVPGYILVLSLLPIGLAGFMPAMSIKNALFQFIMIPVMAIIWYPFFKAYDRQLVQKEAEALATQSEEA